MKATGARIVARAPTLAMCFSTSYLLSKCGTPVCRLAEPTEVKTRCTPAAFAASVAAIPCRISASVPPKGVVTAKREVAPSSAFLIAAVSSSDAATSVAPAFASDLAWFEFVSRVTARLEQSGKGRSHLDEDEDPQNSHDEGHRKSARSH